MSNNVKTTRSSRLGSHQIPKPLEYQARSTARSAPSVNPSTQPLARGRRIPFILFCITTAGMSLYGVNIYLSLRKDSRRASELRSMIPLDNSSRFNTTAPYYDSEVDYVEWAMGISRLRRKLCAQASGHVLEASVGTGRNTSYYPLTNGKVRSVTMIDQSQEMIHQARAKWTDTNAWFMNAAFRIQDASNPVPGPRTVNSQKFPNEAEQGGFDTVVQTMGLCSTGHPEEVLRNLGKMTKEDGKILLLEHGKSHYGWLNDMLESTAPAHAEKHGCWWDKDIGAIVERSGLEVVNVRRYHFGTTWWFELRPSSSATSNTKIPEMRDGEARQEQEERERIAEEGRTRPGLTRPWWSSWWR